jgi:hypothetical protein
MYSATEITYIIEGRIRNVAFKAKGHLIKEGLYQVQVIDEASETVLVGHKVADNPFTALWWAIREWWENVHGEWEGEL